MIVALFALVAFFFSLYSYVLMDANITLFNHSLWTAFRNGTISFGYYQRYPSFFIYMLLLVALFVLQIILVKKAKANPLIFAIIIGSVLIFSYPFLSHDFFNYQFDARIFTLYHQNPYVHKALDFPADQWLRFMHWTHRTYPYGPVFLVISIIPSALSMGKLILSFLFFKIVWVFFYAMAVFFLSKISKKGALFFATSPLVIIEGLINAHNDLIAVTLGIISVVLFVKGKSIISFFIMLLSVGIKYTTLPFMLLLIKNRWMVFLSLLFFSCGLLYLSTRTGLYPWYFLSYFIVLPYLKERAFLPLSILSFFLLLSYYPYIALGFWNSKEYLIIKDAIIWVGIVTTLITLFFSKKDHSAFD